MGSGSSAAGKKQSAPEPSEEELRAVAEKMKLVQKEVKEMMYERERERESREDEKAAMVLALKEAEWKQERKRLREEVRSLRKLVEGKEERIRSMEQLKAFFIEEERAWRDEAVHKWKKLYLAIKKELDDLIHRTHQGGVYCIVEEEEGIEELKRELQEKEGAIKALKMQLASAEYEGYKSKREADILRQSLRIMSNNKSITPNNIANRKW